MHANKFKKINLNKNLIASIALVFSMQVNAQGIDKILEDAFNYMNQGSSMNVNAGSSFNAQGRNYNVGGSVSVRIPKVTVQPVAITLPSIKAGCEGVDLHLGSIDFAGFDHYKKIFQAIPKNAAAYGMKLALGQISLIMKDTFASVEDVVNKINSGTLDACEISKSLVDGGASFVKDAIKMKSVGQAVGKNFSDIKTRMDTAENKFTAVTGPTDAERDQVKNGGRSNPANPLDAVNTPAAPELLLDGNILWKALKKENAGYDISYNEKLLIMSLVGTQIIKNDPLTIVPVKETIPSFMAFVSGDLEQAAPPGPTAGEPTMNIRLLECALVTVVECDVVQPAASNVDGKNTFLYLTEQKMKKIKQNILDRAPMSGPNQAFIQQIRIPMYRMLALALAANKNNTSTGRDGLAMVLIDKYKTIVAIESAQLWLHTMLKVLSSSLEMNNEQYETHTKAAKVLKDRVTTLLRDSEEAHRKEAATLASADGVTRELESLSKSLASNMPANLKKFMSVR